MLKLVLLSPGMAGRSHELKVERTTVGRLDDNTFQVAEPSVSGHHCELLSRGPAVLVRDLSSTNGTFVNGEKITEGTLKVSQILRLGDIEMRLESDEAGTSSKKHLDRTTVIPGGVSLSQLETGIGSGVLGTQGTGFSKKSNRVNQIFIIVGVFLGLVIIGLLLYISMTIRK